MSFHLFGYGSLIFEPECPEHLRGRHLAVLRGYRRSFSSISARRGCLRHEAFDPFGGAPSPLAAGDRHHSLALGLEADGDASVVGVLLEYDDEHADEVFRRTDPREGFDALLPESARHYLKVRRSFRLAVSGDEIEGTIYLSNAHPDCPTRLEPSLSIEERAKVLIAATPRRPRPGDRARGIHYLEGVRRDLGEAGIVDDHLEALASAIRGLPGPWVDLVAPRDYIESGRRSGGRSSASAEGRKVRTPKGRMAANGGLE